ncbi:hypothetical protein KUCAC02_001420 [Chaenocephalus aceratus]|uniref:Uncharacterized protein n=1 Tax=Chaenocephalus aceratus TaxID=36190 RepID=A0ACB9XQM1_CHAAC|nr:hypothetical protein KUCAC02_001420 [Chaenocephalus aceratus]
MQCSWKAVILLALASIAIQYTAIRTLTSKPFQLCPLPSPQNCGLGARRQNLPLSGVQGAMTTLSFPSMPHDKTFVTFL